MTVRRHIVAMATALCAIMLVPELATACSFSTPLIEGASSFKIKIVDYRERPMEGADIVLTSRDKEVARFKSDAQGEALIGNLAPGLYDLSLAQDIVSYFAQGYGLKVTRESKHTKELIFHWPATDVIATNSLSGMLQYWKTDSAGSGIEQMLKRSRGEGKTFPLRKRNYHSSSSFPGKKLPRLQRTMPGALIFESPSRVCTTCDLNLNASKRP